MTLWLEAPIWCPVNDDDHFEEQKQGKRRPAACLLYILIDSRLAAPCVLMLTTMG